jgi:nucleotide-binding universal stress UspA family protein
MKVLLPVDGSVYTKHMLDYVATHDDLFGPANEYSVLTAVPPVPARVANFLSRSTIDEYYGDEAQKVLQPVRALFEAKGWPVHLAFVVGHAVDVIAARAAEERPDLIVMGTHGHSALGKVILGSVTSGVLAKCKSPVLLVR